MMARDGARVFSTWRHFKINFVVKINFSKRFINASDTILLFKTLELEVIKFSNIIKIIEKFEHTKYFVK